MEITNLTSINEIKKFVEKEMNIPDLKTKSKDFELIHARSLFNRIVIRLNNNTEQFYSLASIARFIKQSHANVIHSNKMFESYCAKDRSLLFAYNKFFKAVDMEYLLLENNILNMRELILKNHNLQEELKSIKLIMKSNLKKERAESGLKNKDLIDLVYNHNELNSKNKSLFIERMKVTFKLMFSLQSREENFQNQRRQLTE